MPDLPVSELLELDRRHVWHPYGPMPGRVDPLVVESASGVRLRLADGSGELVDGMSSWWSAIHGYNHPVLNEAAREQLGRMSHVMFGGLTHEPAVRLTKHLVDMSPDGLEHVFLADSGSVVLFADDERAERIAPHLTETDICWRLHFTMKLRHQSDLDMARLSIMSEELCHSDDREEALVRAIAYAQAAFSGPPVDYPPSGEREIHRRARARRRIR